MDCQKKLHSLIGPFSKTRRSWKLCFGGVLGHYPSGQKPRGKHLEASETLQTEEFKKCPRVSTHRFCGILNNLLLLILVFYIIIMVFTFILLIIIHTQYFVLSPPTLIISAWIFGFVSYRVCTKLCSMSLHTKSIRVRCIKISICLITRLKSFLMHIYILWPSIQHLRMSRIIEKCRNTCI